MSNLAKVETAPNLHLEAISENVALTINEGTAPPFAEGLRRTLYACLLDVAPYVNGVNVPQDMPSVQYSSYLQRLVNHCFQVLCEHRNFKSQTLKGLIETLGAQAVMESGNKYGSRSVNPEPPSPYTYHEERNMLFRDLQLYGDTLRSEETGVGMYTRSLLDHVRRDLLGDLATDPGFDGTVYQQLMLGPDAKVDPAIASVDVYNEAVEQCLEVGDTSLLEVMFDERSTVNGKREPNVTYVRKGAVVLSTSPSFISKHEPTPMKFNKIGIRLEERHVSNTKGKMASGKHASAWLTPHAAEAWNENKLLDEWSHGDCAKHLPAMMDFVIKCASTKGTGTPQFNVVAEHMTASITGAEVSSLGHIGVDDDGTYSHGNVTFSYASGPELFDAEGEPTRALLELYDKFLKFLEGEPAEYMLDSTLRPVGAGSQKTKRVYRPGKITAIALGVALTSRYVMSCKITYSKAAKVMAYMKTLITVMRVRGTRATVRLTKRPAWQTDPLLVHDTPQSVIHGMLSGDVPDKVKRRLQMSDTWSGLPTTGVDRVNSTLRPARGEKGIVRTGLNSILTYSGWEIEDILAFEKKATPEHIKLCEDTMLMVISLLFHPKFSVKTPFCIGDEEALEKRMNKATNFVEINLSKRVDDIATVIDEMIKDSVTTGMLDVIYVGENLNESWHGPVLTSRTFLIRLLFSIMSRVSIQINEGQEISTAIFPPRIMRARNIPLSLSRDGWRVYSATAPLLAGLFKERSIKEKFKEVLKSSGITEKVFERPYTSSIDDLVLHGIVRAPLIAVNELPTMSTSYRVVIQYKCGQMYALDSIIAAMYTILKPSSNGPRTAVIYDPRFAIIMMHGKKDAHGNFATVTAVTLSTRTARLIPKVSNTKQSMMELENGVKVLKHTIHLGKDDVSYLRIATNKPDIPNRTTAEITEQIVTTAHKCAIYDTLATSTAEMSQHELLTTYVNKATQNLINAHEGIMKTVPANERAADRMIRRSRLTEELRKLEHVCDNNE